MRIESEQTTFESGIPGIDALLEALEHVLKAAPRSLGDAFVGQHSAPRYRGYMRSQAARLLGMRGRHGRRGGVRREELIAAHGYDTKFAMHCAWLGFQCIELLTTGSLALPIEGEPAEWVRAVRRGEVAFDEWGSTRWSVGRCAAPRPGTRDTRRRRAISGRSGTSEDRAVGRRNPPDRVAAAL